MKTLQQLCIPRSSVFDAQRRDTVLDLTDLVNDRIDPNAFFAENFITEGMKVLLQQGFRRLEGKSDQGIFLLKQAMGGGKTHNLLSLGLLAKHPALRQGVLGKFYTPDPKMGPVQVVAFSGRESDAPFGIWGSIAEQLGKKEHFKGLYEPLQAPGQTAWQMLLKDQTVLILLDELPPYMENARARAIGNSDLAQVTATALSNLLVAINREGCERVCLVITDLTGSYEGGSGRISDVLGNLEKETHRTAMALEPVRMGSDELYQILRTRLFEKLPLDREIEEVAQAYAKAIRDARQMDITSESPEQFATRITAAYPFHPAIRDLYARFRENPGFQQTRGLIRLMRIVTSRLWTSNAADKKYLISAHDIDLNDRETLGEITQINNSLQNAVAHDIASGGAAVAETMDSNLGNQDTSDTCKLLLMASMANVPNAILGLSIPELVAYLCAPGRDVSRIKTDVLEKLATAAWYLHSNRDGKLYFRNVQNLNAKLESLVGAYQSEQAVKELRARLENLFKPVNGWCYQRVQVLPPVDEIELDQDRVTLVISEPHTGSGLRQELRGFWDGATFKNRVAFLSGGKDTYSLLIDSGKRLRAIQHILDDLKKEKVPDNDPQMVQAGELRDRILMQFHSAVRETFTQLWYPISSGLTSADFQMKFEENKYTGEGQILELLRAKKKFEDDVTGEIFRKKVEARLLTVQSLTWSEVKRRAALNTTWQWHRPDALDDLKADAVHKDIWREQGGFVDKGPFPQPDTDVLWREIARNADTGEVTLNVTPLYGDTVYYDVGADASTASAKMEGNTLVVKDMRVSFLTVDSKKEHDAGAPKDWTNRITIKYRTYDSGDDKCMELRSAPPATIHYSTDGSNPRVAGAIYNGDFVIPRNTVLVQAYAERDGIESTIEQIKITWDTMGKGPTIDPAKPATWRHSHAYYNTKDSYEFLARLKKYGALATCVRITITGDGSDKGWIEMNTSEQQQIAPELVESCLEAMRKVQANGQVQLDAQSLYFDEGLNLQAWVEDAKLTLKGDEVRQ
jgi:hypothetical protein